MNVEALSSAAGAPGFEARLDRLTAVADPVRLEIVDLLGAGDASAGEVRTHLGVPSNLLAHHLGVLERAGVVSRHRSHADRRRCYLRLRPDALVGLLPRTAPGPGAERVVFVCTANSARSRLAEALWQRASPVPATSGGTRPGAAVAAGAVRAARRRGVSIGNAAPRSLDGLLRDGDLVVTVCDAAHEESMDPPVRLAGRTHWSVADPVPAGTDAAFDAAVEEIAGRVADLVPRVPTAGAALALEGAP